MKKRNKFKGKGKRNFKVERPIRTVTGTLRGNSRGFAFLSCKEYGDDVFIPAKSIKGAMHGDTVEVDIYSDHGEVKRILSVGTDEITGLYVREMRSYKVIPDDKRYCKDIYVTGGKAKDGDRVIVRLSHKDRSRGEIIAVLGRAGELSSDIAAVIHTLGIREFSQKLLTEAQQSASRDITALGRKDFTAQPCFTVDGAGSKDFDDAVYAEETPTGFRLYVHIADVAEYVAKDGFSDKEAYNRGNSFYCGESVIPMLPEVLSNGVCSLNENEPRYTLSAVMDISACGDITGGEVYEGIICSHKRMTYEKVDKVLRGESDEYGDFMDTLKTLRKLRDVLKNKRDEGGNIDFDVAEPKFTFSSGKVIDVEKAPRLISHSIIEECMIAANRFVAKKFLLLKAPFVYRIHEPPQQEKLEDLNAFLSLMGEKEVGSTSASVAELLKNVPPDKKSAISAVALRCMSKAKYSPSCEGHFGLALKEYCHFTSPIRRYSDLTIHRVIKAYLRGENTDIFKSVVDSASGQASERERICEKAEREIDKLYIADYMAQFVGKEFTGTISGITEWGIYVELDNTAEGMIRAETLGSTQFNAESVSMYARGKGTFRLGDAIKVTLVSASSGNIVFELA